MSFFVTVLSYCEASDYFRDSISTVIGRFVVLIPQIPYVPSERANMEVDLPTTGYNVVEDAKEMLKILERNAEEEMKTKKKTTTIVNQRKRRHDSDSAESSEADDDDDDNDNEDKSDVTDDDHEERHPKHHGCNVQVTCDYNCFKIVVPINYFFKFINSKLFSNKIDIRRMEFCGRTLRR